MPRPCATCTSPYRDEINRALVAGTPRLQLAERYDMAESSLRRHEANHLPAELVKAQEGADVLSAEAIVADIRTAQADLERIMAEARETNDHASQLATLDRIAKFLVIRAKALEASVLRATEDNALTVRWENPLPDELAELLVRVAKRYAAGEFPDDLRGPLAADLEAIGVHLTLASLHEGFTFSDLMRQAEQGAAAGG